MFRMIKLLVVVAFVGASYATSVDLVKVRVARDVDIKQISDAFKEGAGFMEKLLGFVTENSGTITKVASIATTLGSCLGAIGPFFALVSVLLPDPKDAMLEDIKKGIEKLDQRFDQVDRKLTEIMQKVEITASFQEYTEDQDRLDIIWSYFQLYRQSPKNQMRIDDLKDACKDNNYKPANLLLMIHKRIQGAPTSNSLMQSVLSYSQFDSNKLNKFRQMFMADAVRASMIEQACMALMYPNDKVSMQQNADISGAKLADILVTLNNLKSQQESTFSDVTLNNDLLDKLKEWEVVSDHAEFARKLYMFLMQKYNFVSWVVHAFDASATKDDLNLVEGLKGPAEKSYYVLILNKNGRSILVTWNKMTDWDYLARLTYISRWILRNYCIDDSLHNVGVALRGALSFYFDSLFIIGPDYHVGLAGGQHAATVYACRKYMSVSF